MFRAVLSGKRAQRKGREDSISNPATCNRRGSIRSLQHISSWSAEGDDQKVSKITERFDDYCNPQENVTWERHVFNTRNQQPSETIDQYITDLKTKAKSCEFGVLTDSLIKGRIVCGITDDQTRSRLLREPDLTLQKALDICQANEATAT